MVHVNGKKVGGNANISKFTAYVSPYFVVSNGGAYTKHIYAASQRIASKLGNEDGFGADPRRVEQAGGKKISDIQKDNIGARYKELGFTYSAPQKEKVEKDSTMDSEEEEKLIFFYHPDHLGSTSYVTDADGNIAQHVEYIPYGEVFVEERNSQFSTNFLFNAKELDNETGLYYYGARYLDPTGAMWLSVDPLFEKYAGMSPYNYCAGNPVVIIDPTGENGVRVVDDENCEITIKANYYVQTEQRPYYYQRSNGEKVEKFQQGYSEKDLKKMNVDINDYLNNLNLVVSEGEYTGYKVKFDMNFIDGGSVENCEKMATEDKFEGESIGNSLVRANGFIYKGFKKQIIDDGIIETPVTRGGVTLMKNKIMMNSAADSKMNKIHEIFHTLGFNHPKNIGGGHGIMAYPPSKPDKADANELIYNNFLKTIKK